MRFVAASESYPLCWPAAWPRCYARRRAGYADTRTLAQAAEFVGGELRRLGAQSALISSNVLCRQDGLPRSGQPQPADRGVAVYFMRRDEKYVLACDKWLRVEDNLYAIGLHIEALRAQERHGVGSPEQGLRGYLESGPTAAKEEHPWWQVLGVSRQADASAVEAAHRRLSRRLHPDAGGDEEGMRAVNVARDQALEALAQQRHKP